MFNCNESQRMFIKIENQRIRISSISRYSVKEIDNKVNISINVGVIPVTFSFDKKEAINVVNFLDRTLCVDKDSGFIRMGAERFKCSTITRYSKDGLSPFMDKYYVSIWFGSKRVSIPFDSFSDADYAINYIDSVFNQKV